MAIDNPYQAAMLPEILVQRRQPSTLPMVALCYGATVLSGAVFGIWVGPLGLIFGGVFAGLAGLVPFALAIPMCWAMNSGIARVLIMLGCGAITGCSAVGAVFGTAGFGTEVLAFGAAAAGIGGAASAVAAWLYHLTCEG